MAGDGERRELPSFRRGPSAARGHAGRIIRRYDIAGHALNSRLCRVPAFTPAAITVTLQAPAEPRLARALALLTDEINAQPPAIPGDSRPITYRIHPQPRI